MIKKPLFAALAALSLAACADKYDDSAVRGRLDDHEQRLTTLESAVAALDAQIKAGAMIKSVTPIAGSPGGWHIEFTGGSPSSIDIMNGSEGAQGTPGVTPATPQIEVRTGADGTVSIWYKTDGDWTDTGTNIKGGMGEPGAPGAPGSPGTPGVPGTPGAAGVSPQVRVVDNGDGTMTIQYNATAGYPDSGWTNAGSPIALGGNSRDKEAIFSIVENEETGTITITMNDSDTPAERTTFDFAMASGAVRIEIVSFLDGTVIAPGARGSIRFRVNPSNAYVPTGDMTGADAKWQLDQTGTRASYVTAPTSFALDGIAKDGNLAGQYVADIRCTAPQYDYFTSDYALALVLDNGTATDPVFVSSPTFVVGIQEPGIIDRGTTGTYPTGMLPWILYEGYTLVVKGTGSIPNFNNAGPWSSHVANIKTILIGGGVTTIGNRAFESCSALTEVTISDEVTAIKLQAFAGCTALTKVNIGTGVASIGFYAFAYCSALTEITIPSGVTTIENFAFSNCSGLTNVTCLAETPPTLVGSNFGSNTADVLYVLAASVDAYKNNTAWNAAFNGNIEAIPES